MRSRVCDKSNPVGVASWRRAGVYACVASARYRACAVCCCGPVLALVPWLWIRCQQIQKAALDPVLVSWLWIRCRQIRKAALDPVLVSWLWIRCRQIRKAVLDPVLVSWLWIRSRQIRKATLDPVLVSWLWIRCRQIRKAALDPVLVPLTAIALKAQIIFVFPWSKIFSNFFPYLR